MFRVDYSIPFTYNGIKLPSINILLSSNKGNSINYA
jgi:hypothetical protein